MCWYHFFTIHASVFNRWLMKPKSTPKSEFFTPSYYGPQLPIFRPVQRPCLKLIVKATNRSKYDFILSVLQTETVLDFVIIYDGPNDQSTQIVNLSGNLGSLNNNFSSTGNSLLVKFKSDSHYNYAGFLATIHYSKLPIFIVAWFFFCSTLKARTHLGLPVIMQLRCAPFQNLKSSVLSSGRIEYQIIFITYTIVFLK